MILVSILIIAQKVHGNTVLVLSKDCSINILNRTVQVDENGSFRLDNVPSNMGQIKARATLRGVSF